MGYAQGGLQAANPTDSVRSASRSSSTFNPHVSRNTEFHDDVVAKWPHKGVLEQWNQQEWKEKRLAEIFTAFLKKNGI
jgi:hypothetical protein